MNVPPHVPRAPSGGRARLLLGVVFAVILAAATAVLPGAARAVPGRWAWWQAAGDGAG